MFTKAEGLAYLGHDGLNEEECLRSLLGRIANLGFEAGNHKPTK